MNHASIDFIFKHLRDALSWHQSSNTLVQLSAKNEHHLVRLLEKAQKLGIVAEPFLEPDRDNEMTAICLEPTLEAKKMVSNLPLAFKENSSVENRIDEHRYAYAPP